MPRFRLVFEGAPAGLETHRITSGFESTRIANGENLEASIRFISPNEMAHLHRFKGGDGPTNVLTFVHNAGADVAICPAVAEEDAKVRGWDLHSELYYLCIHGCLHALGYDHGDFANATKMEGLERQILADLGLDMSALGP